MADLTPEERQRIYQEEKVRFEAQAALKAERRDKTASGWIVGCLWIVGIVVGLVILVTLINSSNTTTTPEAPLTKMPGNQVDAWRQADFGTVS
jgi:hypothetical protein